MRRSFVSLFSAIAEIFFGKRSFYEFADIIVGRMGVPDRESGINTISVIVRGENERISALCGKLGRVDSVRVKSAIVAADASEE